MKDEIIISADCICDLPQELIEKYSIRLIPFYISMRDVRFHDYTEVDFSSIYEYMEEDGEKIASAPATVSDYDAYFRKLEKENKEIIHICVSGKLSKAYEYACEAAKDKEKIHVVDSGLASSGMGLLVLTAAEFAQNGNTVEEILEKIKLNKKKISCSFVLKSTQYVAHNNRVNRMLSNLLDIFRIKPIIQIKKDQMKVVGVCLGNRETYAKHYIRHILRHKKHISDEVLFITVLSKSEKLKEMVCQEAKTYKKWKHIYVQDASATNLCNVGLGSIGLMFYKK